MTATSPAAPVGSPTQPSDKTARGTASRLLIRDAAAEWLTEAAIAAVGQAVVVAIEQFRQAHRQQPTWAEALSGVDQELLAPLTAVPPGWPLPPAVFRRDLRTRMMAQLKQAGWITYSGKPRSLRVGSAGRGRP